MNSEADPLDHGARVINEIGDGGPAGLLPDPGQNAGIARYLPLHILAKQLGDLGRFGAAAHAAQKLLREAKGIILTHGHFLILGGELRPRSRRRLLAGGGSPVKISS